MALHKTTHWFEFLPEADPHDAAYGQQVARLRLIAERERELEELKAAAREADARLARRALTDWSHEELTEAMGRAFSAMPQWLRVSLGDLCHHRWPPEE